MKKSRVDYSSNLVYSTNKIIQEKIEASAEPAQQKLRVKIEKKHRGGKMATIIENFEGNDRDLNELAKLLKAHCGTGGSAKDGIIIIQGDHVVKIISWLISKGYSQTKKGGG